MSFYGSQLWDNSSNKIMSQIYVAWRKSVCRIFRIPQRTHCALVHLICQDENISIQLHSCFMKKFTQCEVSNNYLLFNISKLCVHDSTSKCAKSLNIMFHLYDINKYTISKNDLINIKDRSKCINDAKVGTVIDCMTRASKI